MSVEWTLILLTVYTCVTALKTIVKSAKYHVGLVHKLGSNVTGSRSITGFANKEWHYDL